ncbi:hypothetical protein CC86DRAFT_470751 [Ophiobolus disseminans]|uniref:Uncharacterized protein n=1 Tax=Ophiobolus disseminans TaxID=1469910 RepID=A0A6A6ZMI5_9PLEO|nr:hypothetical protein CC86DRAFT_470751 [Ophiobolus disseminans]
MSGASVLKEAIQRDDVDAIRSELSSQPEITQDELNEHLNSTMLQGSIVTIKLLLERGAKLNRSSFGKAIDRGEPAVFQMLIERGWDINSIKFRTSAVHLALSHETLLRWLLEHGADLNTPSQKLPGQSAATCATPLDHAARLPDTKAMDILLSHGARLDPEAIYYAI